MRLRQFETPLSQGYGGGQKDYHPPNVTPLSYQDRNSISLLTIRTNSSMATRTTVPFLKRGTHLVD